MNGNQRHLLRNRQQKQVKRQAQQKLQKAANQKFMSPTEEENPDESETLGTIEPIIPENQV